MREGFGCANLTYQVLRIGRSQAHIASIPWIYVTLCHICGLELENLFETRWCDFFDEEWQVGARETQFRGRDAMMFDVWQYVFTVRVRRGQRGVIRGPCEPA
jgi:hypothetical protein